MDKYNNKITFRINKFLRENFVLPPKRKALNNREISLLCNNCNGGILLHDLQLKFNTPTINMFFAKTDFFDFIEHLEFYLQSELEEKNFVTEEKPIYPVGVLRGDETHKDLELHFMHYDDFSVAKKKWETRKQRINFDNLFLMWTFFGEMSEKGNEIYYDRVENLPIKNKVIFVNHDVDYKKYPSFFKICGFEKENGLGVLSKFMNLKGQRYFDQFDYVKWFNERN